MHCECNEHPEQNKTEKSPIRMEWRMHNTMGFFVSLCHDTRSLALSLNSTISKFEKSSLFSFSSESNMEPNQLLVVIYFAIVWAFVLWFDIRRGTCWKWIWNGYGNSKRQTANEKKIKKKYTFRLSVICMIHPTWLYLKCITIRIDNNDVSHFDALAHKNVNGFSIVRCIFPKFFNIIRSAKWVPFGW